MRQSLLDIKRFNRLLPLQDYLVPLIEDKKVVRIADVGSGPLSKTGRILDGVEIEVYPSDKRNYAKFWEKNNAVPLFPIEYQDMEKLTYEDNFFDIVHCVNALDHTPDAMTAVKEMSRVVKPGGWVYVDCYLDQLDTSGKHHYWNVKEDGAMISNTTQFGLKDLGFNIKFIDNHGPRRYNHIIATYKK